MAAGCQQPGPSPESYGSAELASSVFTTSSLPRATRRAGQAQARSWPRLCMEIRPPGGQAPGLRHYPRQRGQRLLPGTRFSFQTRRNSRQRLSTQGDALWTIRRSPFGGDSRQPSCAAPILDGWAIAIHGGRRGFATRSRATCGSREVCAATRSRSLSCPACSTRSTS